MSASAVNAANSNTNTASTADPTTATSFNKALEPKEPWASGQLELILTLGLSLM